MRLYESGNDLGNGKLSEETVVLGYADICL